MSLIDPCMRAQRLAADFPEVRLASLFCLLLTHITSLLTTVSFAVLRMSSHLPYRPLRLRIKSSLRVPQRI